MCAVFVTPGGAIKLSWQAAALHVAKGAEERHDLLACGLKGHVAHHQLGALLLWCARLLLGPGCTAGLAHAQLQS